MTTTTRTIGTQTARIRRMWRTKCKRLKYCQGKEDTAQDLAASNELIREEVAILRELKAKV